MNLVKAFLTIAGDVSAWGCCRGSIFASQLMACRQLTSATCAMTLHCMISGGGTCVPRPASLAEMAFKAEAGSASSRHDSAAATLAAGLLTMPRRCEALGVEECGSVGAVEIDVGRVAAYASLAVTPPPSSASSNGGAAVGGRRGGVAAGAALGKQQPHQQSESSPFSRGGIADSVQFSDPTICIMAAARWVDRLQIETSAEEGDVWTAEEIMAERPQEDEDIVF